MATCKTCGGDNAPGTTRCQYCEQPILDVRPIDLDWDVTAPTGARGRGKARFVAPPGFDAQAARGVLEAAFILASSVAGPEAPAAQVEGVMRERLEGMLGTRATLDSLKVEAVSAFVLVAGPGGQPQAAPGGGGCSLGCVLLALAVCCLSSGLLSFGLSFAMESDAAELRATRVVTPAEAAKADGRVALEAVTVSAVASGAPTLPDGRVCLWLRPEGRGGGGQHGAQWASSFRVGQLEVRPAKETTFDAPVAHPPGTDHPSWVAIFADQPVTVVGRAAHGVIEGRDLKVSTKLSRDAMAEDLERTAGASRKGGLGCSVVGVVLAIVWLLGRRAEAQRRAGTA